MRRSGKGGRASVRAGGDRRRLGRSLALPKWLNPDHARYNHRLRRGKPHAFERILGERAEHCGPGAAEGRSRCTAARRESNRTHPPENTQMAHAESRRWIRSGRLRVLIGRGTTRSREERAALPPGRGTRSRGWSAFRGATSSRTPGIPQDRGNREARQVCRSRCLGHRQEDRAIPRRPTARLGQGAGH